MAEKQNSRNEFYMQISLNRTLVRTCPSWHSLFKKNLRNIILAITRIRARLVYLKFLADFFFVQFLGRKKAAYENNLAGSLKLERHQFDVLVIYLLKSWITSFMFS